MGTYGISPELLYLIPQLPNFGTTEDAMKKMFGSLYELTLTTPPTNPMVLINPNKLLTPTFPSFLDNMSANLNFGSFNTTLSDSLQLSNLNNHYDVPNNNLPKKLDLTDYAPKTGFSTPNFSVQPHNFGDYLDNILNKANKANLANKVLSSTSEAPSISALDALKSDGLDISTIQEKGLDRTPPISTDKGGGSNLNADGKIGAAINQYGSMVNGVVSGLMNNEQTKQSAIANGVLDGISSIGAMLPGPAGMIMSGAALVTKLIGSVAGTNVDLFKVDEKLASRQESSYGGSFNTMRSLKGGRYDLWSLGEAKKLKKLYKKAKFLNNRIGAIDNRALDWFAMADDPTSNIAREVLLNGGNLNYAVAAKFGAKLQNIRAAKHGISFKNIITAKRIVSAYKYLQGAKFKKTRTLSELIDFAKELNPRFIQRLSEPPRGIQFTDDLGNLTRGNVYLEWGTDDNGSAIIYPRILEMDDKKLKFLSADDAYKRAIEKNNYLMMSPEEANIFFAPDNEYQTAYKRGWPEMFKLNWDKDDSIIENLTPSHKEGGVIGQSTSFIAEVSLDSIISEFKDGGKIEEPTFFISEVSLDEILPEFKEGGKVNVIPEGALHARLHHMENDENITKKGIPVVSEKEGGEIEQQAEIEREEIIFRLEVTQKLEELQKKFYSNEYTQKEKDEFSIEAGKLLTHEILNNTIDNTNNLL